MSTTKLCPERSQLSQVGCNQRLTTTLKTPSQALLVDTLVTHHKTLLISHRPTGQLCHAVSTVDAIIEHFAQ